MQWALADIDEDRQFKSKHRKGTLYLIMYVISNKAKLGDKKETVHGQVGGRQYLHLFPDNNLEGSKEDSRVVWGHLGWLKVNI